LGFSLGLFSNERCYRYIQFGGMNMALYLCRWGNGDFSIVQASNKEHAIEMLDEVANAEGMPLYAIKEFMVHFQLTDEGTIELEEFGDDFSEYVLNRVHPILANLHISPYDASAKNKAKIRAAVQAERIRLKRKPAPEPDTEIGKRIKAQIDMPTSLINRHVQIKTREVLLKAKPKGKPN
jgi:hypothetical protein